MTLLNPGPYGPILRDAFAELGLPPVWGIAIARQESAFRAGACNNSGGDAARGGSWGLCQVSLQTARALGFEGGPQHLLDPATNARLAAQLCSQLAARFGSNLIDVAAAYNSGKSYQHAPESARDYAERVLAFSQQYADTSTTT